MSMHVGLTTVFLSSVNTSVIFDTAFLSHSLGRGLRDNVGLHCSSNTVGKLVVDFLLVLIEL